MKFFKFAAFAVPVLLVLSSTAMAQRDMTIEDVAAIQYVSSATISPDGQQIAYTKVVQRNPKKDENGAAWAQLHVVDQSGESRPFVSGQVNISNVQWTPDGKGISYITKRGDDKKSSLYVIPVNGGEARRAVSHVENISAYSWRPDGKAVAFLATESEDPETRKLKDRGFNAEIYEEELKFVRIWTVDVNFDANERPRMLEVEGSASELHYSPDGTKLVVALAPTPLIDHHYMYRRLHVIDAETGALTAKVDNPGKLGPVAWSPDGRMIAFCSGEDINDPSPGRLMVVSSEGGSPGEVMKDYLPNIASIAWEDDDTIAFTADDSCLTAYGSIGKDGSNRTLYIDPNGKRDGEILTSLTLANDGRTAAFLGESPTHPAEVFFHKRDNDEGLARLTDSNPWFDHIPMAKQEIVTYQSRDGRNVEGILVYPLNYEEGTRYPLIVAVHGGPEAHIANGWVTRYSYPGQVGAARGIASFYPNYRGSTGRGVEFAKDHQADYGGKEFNDIIDGIDHLIDQGIVDKDKVGVTGGSYGGFATAWCSTFHSERFAAGVMFVGISNQISKSGTTDIPEEMYLVHARKRIWDDWQFYLERSPVYHVQKCKTPLLILHGKEDPRVHPGQSMELYRNLKILGQAPVRLILYPGEGHGNRKAAARMDYNMRMLRWMEHYLTGEGGDAPPHQLDYGLEPVDSAETALFSEDDEWIQMLSAYQCHPDDNVDRD